ncbi:MAG: hypothetical protein LBV12_11285 [Puniceicoccales bacterium]|jgi:hypothetical protein|nr:hypothetical protein [Puniceicoccales bacterium]
MISMGKPSSSIKSRWKKHRRLFCAAGIPAILLLALLFQWESVERPSIIIQNRYVIRLERIDVDRKPLFFIPTLWEKTRDTIKGLIDRIFSPTSVVMVTSGRYAPPSSKDMIYFWFSCYDKKHERYVTDSSDEPDRKNIPTILFIKDANGMESQGLQIRSESKERMHVIGVECANFDPACPFYYFYFLASSGHGAWMPVENPKAAKPLVPEPMPTMDTLPAEKVVAGIAVVLESFDKSKVDPWSGEKSVIKPKLFISRYRNSETSYYRFEAKISDAWDNYRPMGQAPYWKVVCSLWISEFPMNRLCSLGRLTRPPSGSAQPLTAKWSDGKEEFEAWILLGPGHHYFDNRRWVRSEPVSADKEGQGGIIKAPNSIYSIAECWTRVPALVVWDRTDAGVVLPEAKDIVSTANSYPYRESKNMLIPLDWPEREVEKEIVLGVPSRRDLTFYLTPAEVSRAVDAEALEKEKRSLKPKDGSN